MQFSYQQLQTASIIVQDSYRNETVLDFASNYCDGLESIADPLAEHLATNIHTNLPSLATKALRLSACLLMDNLHKAVHITVDEFLLSLCVPFILNHSHQWPDFADLIYSEIQ